MESGSTSDADGADQRVGVLVVGAGGIAEQHLAALHKRGDGELVGIVDAVAERAQTAARAHGGVRWSTTLSDALSWPGVDGVIICTPNHTHSDLALEIAAAGKHVLVEKPLATNATDARKVVDAYEEAGVTLTAAHTHRFYDYGRAVKRAIDAGAIGRPSLVRLSILGGWIWPDWRGWMLDPARSGGHALHNGVHLLDLVTWWIGQRPVSVFARGQRPTSPELDIFDHLEMVVRYDDGAVAVCEMSRGHRPAAFGQRDVVVQGNGGLLTLPWDAEASVVVDERGPGLLATAGTDGFAAQLDAWFSAVRGEKPAVSGLDGLLAVAMGEAAERSISLGAPVSLEEVTR
ncbi:Gfo/Idh/MocA family protein [Fodinicola acaciae]|uniref:Gfo/Idh/MocA family protein n=1 Tax=Fodinicola acaciae TaxID=2681555 RepID=UPI0013D788C9|nr:Gfo/Idh/MocA family oxidoreductase [Fodinicola acaciae]